MHSVESLHAPNRRAGVVRGAARIVPAAFPQYCSAPSFESDHTSGLKSRSRHSHQSTTLSRSDARHHNGHNRQLGQRQVLVADSIAAQAQAAQQRCTPSTTTHSHKVTKRNIDKWFQEVANTDLARPFTVTKISPLHNGVVTNLLHKHTTNPLRG